MPNTSVMARNEYRLLLGCNAVLLVLAAAVAWHVWRVGAPVALQLERLGRTGPPGVILLAGSFLVAWVELLVVPTLRARAAVLGTATEDPRVEDVNRIVFPPGP